MQLIHEFCRCNKCETTLEIDDYNREDGFVKCHWCNTENKLEDIKETWTKEY